MLRAHRATKRLFYVNTWTGERRLVKPKLMGPEDMDEPPDEFRPGKDAEGKRCYFNPSTGE